VAGTAALAAVVVAAPAPWVGRWPQLVEARQAGVIRKAALAAALLSAGPAAVVVVVVLQIQQSPPAP
jgi:hypothetical protein